MENTMPGHKKGWKFYLSLLVLIIVVLAILFGAYTWFLKPRLNVQTNYQAVFLSNGQVYFAKIANKTSDSLVLTDVYYLRVQKAIQPAEGTTPEQQPAISLIKLGNELHGPTDEMVINRTQVLFTETLKGDSKVVEAINKEKESGAQAK